MTTGFRNSSGTDFDNVFDPYVQGTKPGATGFRTSDGVDLNQRFAPIVFGSAASATGFRLSGGADVNTLWAAKGTANYALPINGANYVVNANRGTAELAFSLLSSGAYTVVKTVKGTQTTLASGTWLPSGETASNYTGQFVGTGFSNGSDPGGGSVSFSNGAPSAVALTTNREFDVSASATTVGTTAGNAGSLVVKLYRLGTLVSTTAFDIDCEATGN